MAKAKQAEAEDALFQFRRRINTGLLARLHEKLEELKELQREPETGHGLEDLEDEKTLLEDEGE